MSKLLGRQLLVEYYGCDRARLDDPEFLKDESVAAAQAMGAHVVEAHCHRFDPAGVSVVIVLSESHLALHTWPEHAIASMDIFVCSPTTNPHRAKMALAQSLRASRTGEVELSRGNLENERPQRWHRASASPRP